MSKLGSKEYYPFIEKESLEMKGKICALGYILLSTLLFGIAQGATRHYDFVLKESNFTRLCSTKSLLTVNGSFPGPEIHAHTGDTVFVTVHNHGTYGVTIHWHGAKQPRNPWSDGPENVTQCPIPPGGTFTQEINLSTEEGTLWWHAHSDWSRATVHGAIIIYPKHGTTFPFKKPDAEQTIVLASWYKTDIMEMITTALDTGGEPNVSDAFTINGQPGDLYNCSKGSTYNLVVEHGKTYLLRIINAVLNEAMFFGIANHRLRLVGSDGAYLKPRTVDYISITPGQTMDVLVTANQSRRKYYIAATPYNDGNAPFDNTTTTAILRYKGNYTAPKSISFPSLPAYNDVDAAENFTSKLRALASKEHPINVPQKITKRIIMTVNFNTIPCANASCSGLDGNRQSASLNNISFAFPKIDILQAYYRNLRGVFTKDFPVVPPVEFNFTGDTDMSLFTGKGTKVLMLNYGEKVEIVFQGTNISGTAESHPMHLHGYSFFWVGKDTGNFNKTTDPLKYNLHDPPEVNTIALPKNGWAAIRFIADNPGVWFLHCHLERHASWGMDTVLIVKNGHTKKTRMRRPPSNMPRCSAS